MRQTRSYLLALASTLAFATTGPLIKYILLNTALLPISLAFWRAAFLALFMLLALRALRPKWLSLTRRDVPFYVAYGSIGVALSQSFWIYSVSLNGAALATALFYVSPAFVALFSRLLFGEPITRTKQVALVLTLAGVALISQAYDLAQFRLGWFGVLVGIASGLVYSTYTLFSKEAGQRHHPWVAMAYAFAFGTLFLGLAQGRGDVLALSSAWQGWIAVLFLALGPTLGGYSLYTLSLRDLPAGIASLILPLELVFAAIIAFLAFGETWHPLQVVGAALIILSILLLQPNLRRRPATIRASGEEGIA